MGRLLLIWRLVVGDIKRRPVQSALLVVMILTTTTALTLGLGLHGESTSPFALTRAATRGPDVVAETGFAPGSSRPSPEQLAPLLHAPGVAATGGPYPVAFGAPDRPADQRPGTGRGSRHRARRDRPAAGRRRPLGAARGRRDRARLRGRAGSPCRRLDPRRRPPVPGRRHRALDPAALLSGVRAGTDLAHSRRCSRARHPEPAARLPAGDQVDRPRVRFRVREYARGQCLRGRDRERAVDHRAVAVGPSRRLQGDRTRPEGPADRGMAVVDARDRQHRGGRRRPDG